MRTHASRGEDSARWGAVIWQGGMAMLVLSRKVGQKIVVPGCDMTISVVNVSRNRVSLGIAAPQELAVHREEVYR